MSAAHVIEVDPRLYWPAQTDPPPFIRDEGDPLLRPLRIFTLDPSISRLEGSVSVASVPWERLTPGPVGSMLEVCADRVQDLTDGECEPPCDLDDPRVVLGQGLCPSSDSPNFHLQMVYAVAWQVCESFRLALGRDLYWGFEPDFSKCDPALPPDRRSGPCRLRIRPFAFEALNAHYSREERGISLGYSLIPEGGNEEKTAALQFSPPGTYAFTSLSYDIIAHEVSHAVLDGLRPFFFLPTGSDTLGFHEGFADLIALFSHFRHRELLTAALRKSKGSLRESSALLELARQLGHSLDRAGALRDALEDLGRNPNAMRRYSDDLPPHQMGSVLVGAVFDAFCTLFDRKTRIHRRIATGGTGIPRPGEIDDQLLEVLVDEAGKLARQILNICIRAIDYCPPVDLRLAEFLRAMLTADYDLVPEDPHAYREALSSAFFRRGLRPPGVVHATEEALRWSRPEQALPAIPRLATMPADPARCGSYQDIEAEAIEVCKLLGTSRSFRQLRLIPAGEDGSGGRYLPPRLTSLRRTRRIGPDGQALFDLVIEIVQERHVPVGGNGEDSTSVWGGVTLIVDPLGRIRYCIARSAASQDLVDRQMRFFHTIGRERHMRLDGTHWVPRPDLAACLHAQGPVVPTPS